MSEDLKRPLFFDVQRVKNAPIALVNRDESKRLKQRHGKQRDEEESESRAAGLPASALPMIRSPRPEKPVYVPSPTRTPAYFRWKPMAPKGNNAARRSSNGATTSLARAGPRLASPRLSAMVLPSRANGNGWSPQTVDPQHIGPSLFGVASDNTNSTLEMPVLAPLVSAPTSVPSSPGSLPSSRPATVTVKQPDLFDYEDMPKPTTPVAPVQPKETCEEPQHFVGEPPVEPTPPINVVSAPVEPPPVFVAPPVEPPTPVVIPVTPVVSLPAPAPRIPTPKLLESPPDNPKQADESSSDDDEDETAGEKNDEPARVAIEFSGGGGGAAARQPQEKAIAQHLLRGKFLRKYLHANNLTRKLKETEQALRSAALMGGVPTMKGGGSLFSRSFIAKSAAAAAAGSATGQPQTPTRTLVEDLLGEEATGLLSDHLPVLRRLSSIDKAINNTAKRIRRMSGIEDPCSPAAGPTRLPSPPTATTPKTSERPGSRKFTPLKAIGEKQTAVFPSHREEEESLDSFDTFEDEFGSGDTDSALVGGAKVDPSSAHMMRICQHVIAKRAIKAFLRQEMSVITIIEVALRDDTHLMPKWLQQSHPFIVNSATMAAHLQQQQASSRASTPDHEGSATPSTQFVEAHRAPIKSMRVEILEAVGGYLKEGDQHLCLEEVYAFALQAERDKLWKRAILLASVCVVLDREFLHGVLLRARCCRRLGLWTQAIKDLAHAILLKPDEYKLVLLRSCLFVKMGELDSALVDVNRALAFFPKSIDALLLRAEIFHRQDAIGASLQDLTTALLYDPGCWRAFYDRATIRIRAIEGDEYSLNYHWEHMKYEKLLASIIEDYVSAVRKGCQMVEVVETIGDLSVRLMEFTGDANVLRQVVSNLSHLLQILAHDHRRSFHAAANSGAGTGLATNRSPSIANAAATVAAVAAAQAGGAAANGLEQQRSAELARELLVASIHAQRGRLLVLLQDRTGALADFDQAVVTEYHYPVAHFYRGAFATLMASSSSSSSKNEDAAAVLAANMQHLNRCISLDPTIAGAYTVRGALFLRDLKFNSALQDFKAAVATDPTLYEVWLQIALIYLNHYHDSDECVRACSSALANDSCLSRALYLRAEAFTRQGNLRAALKDYGRLTIAQPDDRWAQLMRGRLLLQMKLAKPALYAFIQFTQLGAHGAATATDKRALILCGRAYKILARFQQAVDQFQRAVSLNPTSENLVLLSESLHSMGDTENSLRVSEKVINADPNSFRGYVRRAQLLVTTGQFQRAMAEYNTALALAPKEARVFYERGVVQMQLYLRWRVAFQLNFEHKAPTTSTGATSPTSTPATKRKRHSSPFEPRLGAMEVEAALGADQINDERTVLQGMKSCFAGAIADFTKCIRLDPLASEPYVDRAELLVLGEEYDRAFQDLATAVERNPKCARAFVNLGVLKCHFAAFAAAITDFDQAIRVDPKLALAFFNRGVCYQKLELFRHADQSYSRCIALTGAGRDVDAHRNRAIARCHTARDGAFEDALADFEQVRQSAPDDDQLHGGLGYVLLQLGRYEDAARCFAAYGRLNRDTFGDSGNAYFNLACSGQNTGTATNSKSSAVAERHLDQTKYDAYLDKALRLYVRAARLHPSNLDLRLNIANCLRHLQQPRRAIAQCDAIRAARPLHHASLESKALCFYEMGRLSEAVEWMNAAIRACVGSSSALQNIFYAFAQKSIHRHALDRKTVGAARDGEASRPTSSAEKSESMHEAMSAQLLELRQRRLELATPPSADGALPPKPASAAPPPGVVLTGSSKQLLALYMLNRGVLYEKMGAWEDAARDYKDAAHFDPLAVQPLLSLATLRLLQRRLDESRAALTRVLTLEPANGLAHLNLGVVCLCADETEPALAHFEAAIEALPTCSYAYANKAVALAKRGDLRQAEAQLKRAIEELPSRKEYYLARGKIIAQQKRLQDAMVDFSTALFLGYEGKL